MNRVLAIEIAQPSQDTSRPRNVFLELAADSLPDLIDRGLTISSAVELNSDSFGYTFLCADDTNIIGCGNLWIIFTGKRATDEESNSVAPRCLVWVVPGDQSPGPPGIFRFAGCRQAGKIEAAGPGEGTGRPVVQPLSRRSGCVPALPYPPLRRL